MGCEASTLAPAPPKDDVIESIEKHIRHDYTSAGSLASTRALARHFSIDTSRAKSNEPVVSLCAKKLGVEEYPEGRSDGRFCDIYWHNVVYSDMKNVVASSHSKVNKFPGMTELAKKIALTHSICSMQRIFPQEYAFYPKSWFLPAHFNEFQKYYHLEKERLRRMNKSPEMWFIVKPDEGMARFCTEKYSPPTPDNIDNLFAHLTNYSLNKSNHHYVHSSSLQEQARGSKRLLSTVFHQLAAKGLNTKKLWKEIKLIIVKTVLAMVPEMILHYEHHFHDSPAPQCFQIIGFDIMIKEDGMPILLEVNAAPSLTIDHTVTDDGQRVRSIVDEVIKVPLVRDTILLELGILDDQIETETMKCSLSTLIDPQKVEEKASEIIYGFTGSATNVINGLPFHAFLHFLFFVADLKFPSERTVLSKLQKLMAYCDMSLRHYGVRSARLRRTEIDGESSVQIYLLPNRMRRSKSGGSTKSNHSNSNSSGHFKVGPRIDRLNLDDNNNTNHNASASSFNLPRIHRK
ncbi:hypothetical protein WR25_23242 [Diploscapter pachys]|uniref:Tubulin-tyrosine ligase family protein n=1 Tax=Diploscapter pachys TaxID=2018661 RepID=A0A2A2JHJ6_9BILA|nr:hypothetical protein WR25_23242 [Diploscapter pachys]